MELAATAILWLVAWGAIGLSGLALSACSVVWQRNRRMLQLIEGFDKILTGQRDQINEILRVVGIHQQGFEEFDRSISRLEERMRSMALQEGRGVLKRASRGGSFGLP